MTPEEIVKGMKSLSSLPDAVVRANELLDSPKSSVEQIGEVISHDPALSARLLKLVNSAFYNFPAQVDTISRAITLVGTDELRSLILAASVTQAFKDIPPETIDMDTFWHRSVYCGLVAKKLAQRTQTGNAEAMFLTGLLHDIGRLVLLDSQPEQAQKILARADLSGQSLSEAEVKILGFSSTELGAALLQNWQLPKKLWAPVRYQNQPEAAADYAAESRTLNLALKVTDCVEPELKTGKQQNIENLKESQLNGIKLSAEDLAIIATAADFECFEVLIIINPRAAMIF